MNKLLLPFLIVAIMVVSACSHRLAAPQTPSEIPQPTVQLFNKKDLSGWYTFIQNRGKNTDPKKVFTVHDGLIHVSGEEFGCITTNDEYSNYRLVVEFRWGTKTYPPRLENARDNGVLIHSTGIDGGYTGIWMHSIECQIIEGGTGDFLVVGDGTTNFSLTAPVAPEKQHGTYVYQPGGTLATINRGRVNWFARDSAWKDVIGFRGANDVEKPTGEWNRMECIAEGDRVTIILNGKVVNQAQNVKPSRGRIQLQSEGAEIFYRLVELTPLK